MCPHGFDLNETQCFDCQPLDHDQTVSIIRRIWELERWVSEYRAALSGAVLPEFDRPPKSMEEP